MPASMISLRYKINFQRIWTFFQFKPKRFAINLKGIAKGADKITLMLSYPSDEVGNELFPHKLEQSEVNHTAMFSL